MSQLNDPLPCVGADAANGERTVLGLFVNVVKSRYNTENDSFSSFSFRFMITLLTDFGADSSYVAEMKGLLFSLLGERTTLVDLTHSISPQNVLHGAVVWRDTVPVFPNAAVHVGVVDPGVGTERQLLAARFDLGEKTATLVCPDNGLASLFFDDFVLLETVFLTESRFWRKNVSRTFHGRDILAPVAAAIASGEPLRNLGPAAEHPIRLDLPNPVPFDEGVRGTILWVDRFGNLITNLSADDHPETGTLELNIPRCAAKTQADRQADTKPEAFEIRRTETYGDAEPETLVLLVGSSNRMEIACVNGSAAEKTGLKQGDRLEIVESFNASEADAANIQRVAGRHG